MTWQKIRDMEAELTKLNLAVEFKPELESKRMELVDKISAAKEKYTQVTGTFYA